MSRWWPRSVFSRPTIRVINVAYLLGAAVALFAFGVAIERHTVARYLPGGAEAFEPGRLGTLGLLLGIATLSLAGFLVLRRIIRERPKRIAISLSTTA